MNRLTILLAALALTACTQGPTPAQQAALTAAAPLAAQAATSNATVLKIAKAVCKTDAAAQPIVIALGAPIAAAVVPQAAPAIAGAVALDQTALHPVVASACAGIGATAVAGVPAP